MSQPELLVKLDEAIQTGNREAVKYILGELLKISLERSLDEPLYKV